MAHYLLMNDVGEWAQILFKIPTPPAPNFTSRPECPSTCLASWQEPFSNVTACFTIRFNMFSNAENMFYILVTSLLVLNLYISHFLFTVLWTHRI